MRGARRGADDRAGEAAARSCDARWPQRMRSIWGCRAMTGGETRRAAAPAWSIWSIPVRNGGWCIITNVGRPAPRQDPVEPVEPLGAEFARMLAGDVGVERDDAQRIILDGVVQKPCFRQIAGIGERSAQLFARIVVAEDQIGRHCQRREQRAQMAYSSAPPWSVRSPVQHDRHRAKDRAGSQRRYRPFESGCGIDDRPIEAACRRRWMCVSVMWATSIAISVTDRRCRKGRRCLARRADWPS